MAILIKNFNGIKCEKVFQGDIKISFIKRVVGLRL